MAKAIEFYKKAFRRKSFPPALRLRFLAGR